MVLVAVGTVGMAAPEAALAQLVTVTLLAAVAETHHALAPAVRTFDRMEDWRAMEGRGFEIADASGCKW